MNNSDEIKDSASNEVPAEEKSFFGIIIHSFFVIPFLIAVFGILLFAAVRLLTMEQHTVYDYLNDVKTGSLTKRWQSAFELSKILANPKLVPNEERFSAELISAFVHAKNDDDRVRQYLALAMGRTGNVKFTAPLIKALEGENDDNLYYLIYALGMLRDKSATLALLPYLENQSSKIRLISVIALGDIADPKTAGSLKKMLFDSEPNVGWDAAIALAKMNDAAGRDVLLKLLDRGYLSKFPEVDTEEQNRVLMVAIQAAAMLDDAPLRLSIKQLSQNDPNLEVRKTALTVIK